MDIQAFMQSKMQHPTKEITVSNLQSFFGEEKPVWVVRGLSASELSICSEASKKNDALKNLLAALASGVNSTEKAETVANAMGVIPDDPPADIVKRIEMLTLGSVSPKLDGSTRDVVLRLQEFFPEEFYTLTNAILELTSKGAVMGEQKPSTGKRK